MGGPFVKALPDCVYKPGYRFIYDATCTDYDWLVVYDELPGEDVGTYRNGCEVLRCPKNRTILCTWEPVSIKSYSRAYTRQFRHFLSNRPFEAERHPGYRLGCGYFIWFVHNVPAVGKVAEKTELVSAVCSAKRMKHTRHHERFELISALAKSVPGFAWYGRGVKDLEKKEDALLPFKYHVAIENHIAPNHWSEKLSDAILCETLPFYAGDPLLGEILPPESFIPIPLDDPEEAKRIVSSAIEDGAYEKRREAILRAKKLILEKYNFWAQVIEVIESAANEQAEASGSAIYARRALRKHSFAAAFEDLVSHLRKFFGRGRGR